LEIKKVLERGDGVKMIIVPKGSDIIKGDYVGIIKLNEKEVKKYGREKN